MKRIKHILLLISLLIQLSLNSQLNLSSNVYPISSTFNEAFYITNEPKPKNLNLIKRQTDFDEALVYYTDIGLTKDENHSSLNLSIAWQNNKGWEFGIGFAGQENMLDIPVNNENGLLTIVSKPVFIQSKYFFYHFFDNRIKPYAKLSMGYSFNNTREEGVIFGNGFLFENGIGIQARVNRQRNYIYFECAQYNLRAKGSVNIPNENLDLNFKIWFNDIVFRLGWAYRFPG